MAAFKDEVYIQKVAPVEPANNRGMLSEILICHVIQDMKFTPFVRALLLEADCDLCSGFVLKIYFGRGSHKVIEFIYETF
jgi:hypothetical protein